MPGKFDQAKYIAQYGREHYKRVTLLMTEQSKEALDAAAQKQGKSVNRFIGDLIADAVPEFEPIGSANEE